MKDNEPEDCKPVYEQNHQIKKDNHNADIISIVLLESLLTYYCAKRQEIKCKHDLTDKELKALIECNEVRGSKDKVTLDNAELKKGKTNFRYKCFRFRYCQL